MTVATQGLADCKDSYMNYLDCGIQMEERMLHTFDSLEAPGWIYGDGNSEISLDVSGRKGETGCLTVRALDAGWVEAVRAQGAFLADASDKKHTFIKLWMYVEDIGLLEADKSSEEYTDQGTIFLDVNSGTGEHQWNHTFRGSGWHELELSFCNSNSYPESMDLVDYSRLSALRIRYIAKPGLVVKFEDLRIVTYSSDYRPKEAPHRGRLISNCDYDEFSGVVLGEWYGASFDLEDKQEGSSCLRVRGNGRSSEYRVYIGDLNIPMNREEDVLCFWLYISDIKLTGDCGWNLEINEVQDVHEYSCDFDEIAAGCADGIRNGWNHIRIPLRRMKAELNPTYGDTVTLHAFRLTAAGTSGTEEYVIKVDQIYLARECDLD